MNGTAAGCELERRRDDVRHSALYGIDYVETGASLSSLDVHFLGKAPPSLDAQQLRIEGGAPVTITALRLVHESDPAFDDWLEIDVDRPGDACTYTLSIVDAASGAPLAGFDPRFASATFSFAASCPSDLDCCAPPACAAAARTAPDIDYLAKDYDSFRRLITDRLALTMPDWQESHAPDLGVMLVELLAYAGDQLSYYQDAVATEAYLNTARLRISLRRHARLVDYAMHEGCNARAWVCLAASRDVSLDLSDIAFCTAFAGSPDASVTPALRASQLAGAPPGSVEWFEPLWPDRSQTVELRAAHSEIAFYTWGDGACCLPAGATRATLADRWLPADGAPRRALNLRPGDVLIFEEVLGPRTGEAADADPAHRQAVRLTRVTPSVDPLYDADAGGRPVVEIEWCTQDALRFALCLSAVMPAPDCGCRDAISVARGNVLLVDHGMSVGETLGGVPPGADCTTCATDCAPPRRIRTPARFAPQLGGAPLTFAEPLSRTCCAADLIAQAPRRALPQIVLIETPVDAQPGANPQYDGRGMAAPGVDGAGGATSGPAGAGGADSARRDVHASGPSANAGQATDLSDPADSTHSSGTTDTTAISIPPPAPSIVWTPAADLIDSGPDDRRFVVETDDDGIAHVRFGNGVEGRAPDAGASFAAHYRLGNGPAGNVGAESIRYLVFTSDRFDANGLAPRNPLPATGGTAPETAAEVRMFAPHAFRATLERAITADDYAALAVDNARRRAERPAARCAAPFEPVLGAQASLCWSGSGYEARVAVDPRDRETLDAALAGELHAYLARYRRIGHDLRIAAADYVPLDLGLAVCVTPQCQRAHVKAALAAVFGSGTLPGGRPAMFAPANRAFGQRVYVSRIIAAAQALDGVIDVRVTRLCAYVPGTPAPGAAPDHVPAHGVLALGAAQIASLDDDPRAPGHGRLTLLIRGGL
ncbi:putative baseplate assembly protein [Burkholderia singularis]|uniref:Baseplate assembly protein n=1 Tax=Burkholderia singularis TaxID=1503053 RepID=A0A238H8Y8_9BURK|nr:putative baseplate assembly protein [Burkholderia singularis]SMG01545.1 FIG01132885: hypothetical protein [Burkholderia singularis]